MAIKISILGATGSVGSQTLNVIAQHPDRFKVVALTAHSNHQKLQQQCVAFQPEYVVCVDEDAAVSLRASLKTLGFAIEVLSGADALVTVATDSSIDMVMAAIVGSAGLVSTFAAVKAGKHVLLANKEALVMAGQLFMDAVAKSNAILLPVDSEHNALFQCMPDDYLPGQGRPEHIDSLILTASGGPFLKTPIDTFASITPQQAVAHPNWEMGAKISVDSATMMNKGLEVIEAHWLFAMPLSDIEVIIHPQSVIHSLVRYCDGSLLAQCGVPDMRTPISYCLSWPDRLNINVERLDLLKVARFDFSAPDEARFPCLKLAKQALIAGPVTSIVLNAANEIAVDAFLKGKISFNQIAQQIELALAQADFSNPTSIDDVIAIDKSLRRSDILNDLSMSH